MPQCARLSSTNVAIRSIAISLLALFTGCQQTGSTKTPCQPADRSDANSSDDGLARRSREARNLLKRVLHGEVPPSTICAAGPSPRATSAWSRLPLVKFRASRRWLLLGSSRLGVRTVEDGEYVSLGKFF